MTTEDIKKLETKLGVQLPEAYRDLLLKPPFDEDSPTYEFLALHDVDLLIEDSLMLREQAQRYACLQPRTDYLCIGSDLSESRFVMHLTKPGNPVLEVDIHETEEVVKTYPSLADFVTAMRESDAEAKQDDERVSAGTNWPAIIGGAVFILGWVIYIAYKFKQVK